MLLPLVCPRLQENMLRIFCFASDCFLCKFLCKFCEYHFAERFFVKTFFVMLLAAMVSPNMVRFSFFFNTLAAL